MAGVVLIAFLGGLVAGSFVTAVAHRVPRGISIAGPRSQCPACGAQIASYDNVPVLSWALLRGRARCCGAQISSLYPLTELSVGVLFAVTVLVHRHASVAEIAIDSPRSPSPTSSSGSFPTRSSSPARSSAWRLRHRPTQEECQSV
jgi:hypothetical protein